MALGFLASPLLSFPVLPPTYLARLINPSLNISSRPFALTEKFDRRIQKSQIQCSCSVKRDQDGGEAARFVRTRQRVPVSLNKPLPTMDSLGSP